MYFVYIIKSNKMCRTYGKLFVMHLLNQGLQFTNFAILQDSQDLSVPIHET